jgi:dTDP-4-dehydrorhamnose 3,5-epimerase
MEITATAIPDVKLIRPRQHGDHRGFFSEVYNAAALRQHGIETVFVQDNHSLSAEQGVVRGLHYQLPPAAQVKLIRVVRGAILDVAVDVRRGSPTFGKHVTAILSAQNWQQIYVPTGFAHGFATLEPNTEVIYKVTAPYSPAHERGVRWDDPALGIEWGVPPERAVLSERDRTHPLLAGVAVSDLFA